MIYLSTLRYNFIPNVIKSLSVTKLKNSLYRCFVRLSDSGMRHERIELYRCFVRLSDSGMRHERIELYRSLGQNT